MTVVKSVCGVRDRCGVCSRFTRSYPELVELSALVDRPVLLVG